MIPREKIEEIKDRADIVEVVSEYVPLKRRGRNYVGLCPFHSEKTPSFTVSEEKGIFYCFGCHTGGSVITFLMKKEGISFPEAVRSLARRYGIIVQEDRGYGEEWDLLYNANRMAMEYFRECLRSREGREAREYLKDRGYEGDMVERFCLGYAPQRWDGLTGYLGSRGISLETAEKVGVVVKGERGYFDRFRGRLIFPIFDPRGRPVGFGGRSLDGKEPKYLNSPESPVFRKGRILYGFWQARESIRRERAVVIVEGYFDLLALHRAGITNSVATMGTALTPDHLRGIKGYVDCVYTVFDGDEAGRKATLRGLDVFLQEDVRARVVVLPVGTDPDEFLKVHGGSAMKDLLSKADTPVGFYLRELKQRFDLGTPEGKADYLDRAVTCLRRIKNIAERAHYAGLVASMIGIGVDAIYRTMESPSRTSIPRVMKGMVERAGSRIAEMTLIKVIIKHPELYDERVERAISIFKDPVLKEVGRAISSSLSRGSGIEPSGLLDDIEDEEAKKEIADFLLREEDGFVEEPSRMVEDCLKKIHGTGKPRETTEEFLRRLEQSGRIDLVEEMRARIQKRM